MTKEVQRDIEFHANDLRKTREEELSYFRQMSMYDDVPL